MPLAHFTKSFGIKEARISKLLTDPAGAPPATWGASVALPGAKKLTYSEKLTTKYLRGDNAPIDSDSARDQGDGTFSCGKVSYDAMAIFYSTLVVDAGTTPNQTATWTTLSTDNLQYFMLQARSAGADYVTGDSLITLYKCKLTSGPTRGLMEEDYQLFDFSFTFVPLLANKQWYSEQARETALALP
jgi:hypothetical protein